MGGAVASRIVMGRLRIRLSTKIARTAVRGPSKTMRGGGACARLAAVGTRAAGRPAAVSLPLELPAARARGPGAVDVRAELGVLLGLFDELGYATCHV